MKVLYAFAFAITFSQTALASDPFNYSAFYGHFVPAPPCQEYAFDLVADPINHSVEMQISPTAEVGSPFENINQGPMTFNSCWSDGIMGYNVTTGQGNKLVATTIYEDTGFFCEGGPESFRDVTTLKLVGDQLTYHEYNTGYGTGFSCTLVRK